MAIDRNKTKEFIEEVEDLVQEIVPEKYKDKVMELLIGPAIEELRELVEGSRPPVFYLVGRSGHGNLL